MLISMMGAPKTSLQSKSLWNINNMTSLQDSRIDIDIQNDQGYTALHLIVIYDDLVH